MRRAASAVGSRCLEAAVGLLRNVMQFSCQVPRRARRAGRSARRRWRMGFSSQIWLWPAPILR